MYYVYILRANDNTSYTGVTTDLKRRIQEHASGNAQYSSGKTGLELKWYCAFADKTKAYEFEKYLKSGSGNAFRNKRLL